MLVETPTLATVPLLSVASRLCNLGSVAVRDLIPPLSKRPEDEDP